MKMICGLPITGMPHEEFIPSNHQLQVTDEEGKRLYPMTVSKLLFIHTELCVLFNESKVSWSKWIDYFHRGWIIFGASGKITSHMRPKQDEKIFSLPLQASETATLVVFITLWLSRFLFPTRSHVVRLETFVMACKMTQGSKISLAPVTIDFVYRVLDNDLESFVLQRNNYDISHLAVAQRRLFCNNTHARFFIPFQDRILSSNEPIYVIREIKEIPARSLKEAVKLADCGNTTDPNSPNFANAQNGNNLSNATFFQGAKKISSQEEFVKDVDHEGVEVLSHKLSDHLKTLQDLNSQLQDSCEQLQEHENQKTVLQKEKARIEAEML
ncbi:hypothetical protein ACH5RR_029343 [Cinchona calisaya]|uniref:Aminotransferase-like plant mobile domain-containing protein n=1 Tax=Cinchona calisaya TaxID=153742 RepID=A0ABD2YVU0_9GENT